MPRVKEQVAIVLKDNADRPMTLTEVHAIRSNTWNIGIDHGLGATGAALQMLVDEGLVTRSHNGRGASVWRWTKTS
jgi:hypothetical protein